MSLKMSLAPQAPCIFKVTVCARLTLGMATVAAAPAATAVAPVRNAGAARRAPATLLVSFILPPYGASAPGLRRYLRARRDKCSAVQRISRVGIHAPIEVGRLFFKTQAHCARNKRPRTRRERGPLESRRSRCTIARGTGAAEAQKPGRRAASRSSAAASRQGRSKPSWPRRSRRARPRCRQQAARLLVGRVQHHAHKTGRGQAGSDAEIRLLVRHQHRDQPDASCGQRGQSRGQRAVVAAGEEAELDDVHAGGRRRPRRRSEERSIWRQIAHGGADRPATADQGDRLRHLRQGPRPERSRRGSLRSIRSTPAAAPARPRPVSRRWRAAAVLVVRHWVALGSPSAATGRSSIRQYPGSPSLSWRGRTLVRLGRRRHRQLAAQHILTVAGTSELARPFQVGSSTPPVRIRRGSGVIARLTAARKSICGWRVTDRNGTSYVARLSGGAVVGVAVIVAETRPVRAWRRSSISKSGASPACANRQGRRASEPLVLDSFAYVEQLVMPMAMFWRSWLASWGSLWLAPLGLQVSPLVPQSALEAEDSVDPRG